jgi:hypothetical protein
MQRATILIAMAAVLAGMLACTPAAYAQPATPTPLDLPEAVAPDGLGRVTLPTTEAEIVDLFARMPDTAAGQVRASGPEVAADRVILTYGTFDPAFGPPVYLQAIDFAQSDFFPPEFTAGDYVASVAGIPDFGTVAYGREGSLAWVLAASSAGVAGDNPATPAVERPIYTLTWGEIDSKWIFSAAATTPEELEALVIAFVQAAESRPADATPSAATSIGTA